MSNGYLPIAGPTESRLLVVGYLAKGTSYSVSRCVPHSIVEGGDQRGSQLLGNERNPMYSVW
eukprot:scaffold410_cov66-Phaeocystis_antarctica.AAC.2